VCTATSLGSVSQVYFRVAGRPTPAVDGAGRERNDPVSCDDYEELFPAAEPADEAAPTTTVPAVTTTAPTAATPVAPTTSAPG
jgi:hypothetical protein